MKRLVIGTAALALAAGFAAPTLACQGEHGYKKTAMLLEQSTMTSEKKAALMQVIAKSEADHDKHTAAGDYGKMFEAVQELDKVKSQIGN